MEILSNPLRAPMVLHLLLLRVVMGVFRHLRLLALEVLRHLLWAALVVPHHRQAQEAWELHLRRRIRRCLHLLGDITEHLPGDRWPVCLLRHRWEVYVLLRLLRNIDRICYPTL